MSNVTDFDYGQTNLCMVQPPNLKTIEHEIMFRFISDVKRNHKIQEEKTQFQILEIQPELEIQQQPEVIMSPIQY